MALDPIFATAAPGYFQSAAYLREEIAGLEGDIEGWQETVEYNRQRIPELQREMLERRLDVAQAQLKIYQLEAALAAKEGGSR
jgi:hypothetical protein